MPTFDVHLTHGGGGGGGGGGGNNFGGGGGAATYPLAQSTNLIFYFI